MIYYFLKQLILRHETMYPLPRMQCFASMKARLCIDENTTLQPQNHTNSMQRKPPYSCEQGGFGIVKD